MAVKRQRDNREQINERIPKSVSRRRFIEYLGGSPFLLPLAIAAFSSDRRMAASLSPVPPTGESLAGEADSASLIGSPEEALNIFDFIPVAEKNISEISTVHWPYVMTGSDDNLTVRANRDGFQLFQIRARRFVDVRNVDPSVELFGERYASPIMLAPIGSQQAIHGEGELATARAARKHGAQFILSTVASHDIREVAQEYQRPLWFQLYPTDEWGVTLQLIKKAERADCPVLVLTADNPVRSNREFQKRAGDKSQPQCRGCHEIGVPAFFREHAIFEGIDTSRASSHLFPITWDLVDRIRSVTRMKIVIKGVVTADDAELCVKHGIDAIVVSNHGGRQEESLLSTIEVLPEVVKAVNGEIPVLIDSGFRRGTDVFKALALGATAVCIGRPYIWGLGAFGQAGVERVLGLLQAELVLAMQLAGTTSIPKITPDFVRRRSA